MAKNIDMTNEERDKVFELRCKAKIGNKLTNKEFKFIQKMFEKYPEEYSAMNKEVFDATKPFGAI